MPLQTTQQEHLPHTIASSGSDGSGGGEFSIAEGGESVEVVIAPFPAIPPNEDIDPPRARSKSHTTSSTASMASSNLAFPNGTQHPDSPTLLSTSLRRVGTDITEGWSNITKGIGHTDGSEHWRPSPTHPLTPPQTYSVTIDNADISANRTPVAGGRISGPHHQRHESMGAGRTSTVVYVPDYATECGPLFSTHQTSRSLFGDPSFIEIANIEDGSPAALALQASADVRITKFDKFMRKMNSRSVRRVSNRASLSQAYRSVGAKRGKPPRVPERVSPPGPPPPPTSTTNSPTNQQHHSPLSSQDTTHDIDQGHAYTEEGKQEEDAVPLKKVAAAAAAAALGDTSVDEATVSALQTMARLPGSAAPAPAPGALGTASKPPPAHSEFTHGGMDTNRVEVKGNFVPLAAPTSSFVFGTEDARLPPGAFATTTMPPAAKMPPPEDGTTFHTASSRKWATSTIGIPFPGRESSSISFSRFQERRIRRRNRRQDKKNARKSYVKGKVIDHEHELYTLSIAVMLGLRTSIGITNKYLQSDDNRKWIENEDFRTVEKFSFPPQGSDRPTPPHQLSHTFKFKDYAPLAFAYLRRMFGINEYEFLLSVCGNANFIEFISNAKSGQFFFYSSDGKYMIKTMTDTESRFLRRILPHYFRHCAQNPNTLLTKFLGMYRVKLYHLQREVKFIIMNSVFDTDKHLQTFFDLKGSTIGRDAKPGESVKKDNDVRRGMPESAFALPPAVRNRMRKQVESDVRFLSSMSIMDYSMLVGVHHIPSKVDHSSAASAGLSFRERPKEPMVPRDLGKYRSQSVPDVQLPTLHQRPLAAGMGHDPSIPPSYDRTSSKYYSTYESLGDVNITASTTIDDSFHQQSMMQTPSHEIMDGTVDPHGDRSIASYSTLDHYFEEDDDNSYLEGAYRRNTGYSFLDIPGNDRKMDVVELKQEDATEQMYWPFHRFFEINGRRRMMPLTLPRVDQKDPKFAEDDDLKPHGVGSLVMNEKLAAGWEIPEFALPLSNRKDGGLVMDVSGLELPMKIVGADPGVIQLYDGKIFYMGIIDILQQFNIRKRFEARLRRLQGGGWEDASCVNPKIYAERFLRFFDEYSQRPLPHALGSYGSSVHDSDEEGAVEVVVFKSLRSNDGEHV